MKKSIKYTLIISSLVAACGLTSCLPLAAGAAGGYILSEEGYKLQSPISKD
ncbi:hypothetical protein OAB00_01955 [Akkermansiaceae bacterium]|nr:hypothetical protein [Akkermansiaceae bacterium]